MKIYKFIIKDALRISLLILNELIDFKFAWYYKRNSLKIRYPIFNNISKLMVNILWRNEWIAKKYFVGSYTLRLKDGIYAVTNIGVEIFMYIQILILMKAGFFLEGIHRSNLIIKKPPTDKAQTKTSILKTNEKSGNHCSRY